MRVFKLRCDEIGARYFFPRTAYRPIGHLYSQLMKAPGTRSKIANLLQFGRLHVTKQIKSSRKSDPSQYVKLYEDICTRFRLQESCENRLNASGS